MKLVTQVLTRKVLNAVRPCLNHLVSKEEELSKVADNVAVSAHVGIVIEDNDEQGTDEEQDVEDHQFNEKLLCRLKLVVDNLLDGILLVKLNVLLRLDHQLRQVELVENKSAVGTGLGYLFSDDHVLEVHEAVLHSDGPINTILSFNSLVLVFFDNLIYDFILILVEV